MKAFKEKSSDTAILEEMIRRLEPNETLTYEEMSKALGRDVRQHCFGNFQSARRACENQDGIVLDVIKNLGYKRLDNVGIVDASIHDRKKVQRISKRSLRKLSNVEYSKLPYEKQREHTTAAAQFGALSHFASTKARKQIESRAEGKSKIPLGDTLKLFLE